MPLKDHAHIRIISPASRDHSLDLSTRIDELKAVGLSVSYHKLSPDPSWPFTAGSHQDRLTQLCEALLDPTVDYLLSLRGGYGASDILDSIPWDTLRQSPAKTIVGFSDISALHSSFYTKLNWPGLHAPMPATDYWGQNDKSDIFALIEVLQNRHILSQLPLEYLSQGLPPKLEGPAFGGCLAVLSSLIGTAYFPKKLDGHILYWEDIGEHPARVFRYLNQWQQSGALKGVAGLILGRFLGCEVEGQCSEAQMRQTIAKRVTLPVWYCSQFGHCSPNWPLPIGLPITILGDRLQWGLNRTLINQ